MIQRLLPFLLILLISITPALALDMTIITPEDNSKIGGDIIIKTTTSTQANLITDITGPATHQDTSTQATTHITILRTPTNFPDGTYTITLTGTNTENEEDTTQQHLTIHIDNTQPIISNVNIQDITPTTTRITWTTNEQATSTIAYGAQPNNLDNSKENTTHTTTHEITLTNLDQATDYYFSITSCDQANNCATATPYAFITDSIFQEAQEETNQPIPQEEETQTKKKKTGSNGAVVITSKGLSQTYPIGRTIASTIITKPSASPKFIVIQTRAISRNENTIFFEIAKQEHLLTLNQPKQIDIDNDNILDLYLELTGFPAPDNARIFIKSIHQIITPNTNIPNIPEILEDIKTIEQTPTTPNLTQPITTFLFILLVITLLTGGILFYTFHNQKT